MTFYKAVSALALSAALAACNGSSSGTGQGEATMVELP